MHRYYVKLLCPLLGLPDNGANNGFFQYLIVCPEAEYRMQIIGKICPGICRKIPDSGSGDQFHIPQGRYDLITGIFVFQFLFKDTEEQKGKITGQEMRFDPLFNRQVNMPVLKVALHDPERFLDLPSSFADFQDVFW